MQYSTLKCPCRSATSIARYLVGSQRYFLSRHAIGAQRRTPLPALPYRASSTPHSPRSSSRGYSAVVSFFSSPTRFLPLAPIKLREHHSLTLKMASLTTLKLTNRCEYSLLQLN